VTNWTAFAEPLYTTDAAFVAAIGVKGTLVVAAYAPSPKRLTSLSIISTLHLPAGSVIRFSEVVRGSPPRLAVPVDRCWTRPAGSLLEGKRIYE
jgi:hypothetical protein